MAIIKKAKSIKLIRKKYPNSNIISIMRPQGKKLGTFLITKKKK